MIRLRIQKTIGKLTLSIDLIQKQNISVWIFLNGSASVTKKRIYKRYEEKECRDVSEINLEILISLHNETTEAGEPFINF